MDSAKPNPVIHRPPVVLAGLLVLSIAGFIAVNRLVHKFQHHEQDLGRAMFLAGQQARESGKPQAAIANFRAALSFDRDNYQYQLNLARALAEAGRVDESESYLIRLSDRAPQDGDVNLQLARLDARRDATEEALRRYHSAIYGIWQRDPDENRRKARMELVDFLLQHNNRAQAQSELIAMAAALPPDSGWHAQVAGRFVQAHDYQHALDEYRLILKANPQDADALAGAGKAAYELAEYATAGIYLRTAIEVNPQDATSAEILKTTGLVLEADPFHRRLADSDRRRRFAAAFQQAGQRLQSCGQSRGVNLTTTGSSPTPLQSLYKRWQEWKPRARLQTLPADPDTTDSLMDLVSEIEEETQKECGQLTGLDLALLLVARNREGGDR